MKSKLFLKNYVFYIFLHYIYRLLLSGKNLFTFTDYNRCIPRTHIKGKGTQNENNSRKNNEKGRFNMSAHCSFILVMCQRRPGLQTS